MLYVINQVIIIMNIVIALGFQLSGNMDNAIMALGWGILFSILNLENKDSN